MAKAVKKAAKKAAPKKATKKTAAKKSVKKAAPAAPSRNIKVTAPAGKAITASALLQIIADQNEMSRAEAKKFVESYIATAKGPVLKGVTMNAAQLGMVRIRHRKARIGRNPQTGEPVKIKASKKLAFRQSAAMKAAI